MAEGKSFIILLTQLIWLMPSTAPPAGQTVRARQGPEFHSYCHYDPWLTLPASEITLSKHLAGLAEREQVHLNKQGLLQGFFYDPAEVRGSLANGQRHLIKPIVAFIFFF